MNENRELINKLIAKGHVMQGNRLYTPTQAKRLNIVPEKNKRAPKSLRTFNTLDPLNIANKEKHADQFTRLIEIELNIEIWPEYRFAKEKGYKLDYALPRYKIGIECDGGINMRGKSGHSSGTGIQRDIDKASCLAANGWLLIRRTPKQLITIDTINLIKKSIENKQ